MHGGTQCSNKEDCTMEKTQRQFVTDRLPPVLRFEFYEDVTSNENIQDFRPFDDITETIRGRGIHNCDVMLDESEFN